MCIPLQVNMTSQFDKSATALANSCAKQCSDWSECRSFDFMWDKRACYLSKNSTAPRTNNPNGILFVRIDCYPCARNASG
jgi:hypothetical protein